MTPNPQPTPGSPPAPNTWPVLSLHECRVLGVLVEKAKTTPESYPLSLNALVTGCNQKSNREPVLNLDEIDVENTLAGLQKRLYVQKIVGGRVERWRHVLYEVWHVNKLELALLAELLLRGPQTEGELRGRASRMEPIDDLDALRVLLRSLADRGLVAFLSPEGRRGAMVAHGFHSTRELERSIPPISSRAAEPSPTAKTAVESIDQDRIATLESKLNELATERVATNATLAQLQLQMATLTEQMAALKRELGG